MPKECFPDKYMLARGGVAGRSQARHGQPSQPRRVSFRGVGFERKNFGLDGIDDKGKTVTAKFRACIVAKPSYTGEARLLEKSA